MAEFVRDQDEALNRYNTAAFRINEIASAAGRLGVAGAVDADINTLAADQENWYRQLAEAQLDMPVREELEAQKANAETDLEETQVLHRALLGRMTSPNLETSMFASMIKDITGQQPSSDAMATVLLNRIHGLESHAASLQGSIYRLGHAAMYMAEGGVKASLVTAERRAAIEADVKEARRAALEEQARREAEAEPVNRPVVGAEALIRSGSLPMTIGELAEAVYGRVSNSAYVMARQMATNAVDGKGELARELQARGYRLTRVEVENPNAGKVRSARKTLVAYEAGPLQPKE